MIKKYLYILSAAALIASCEEDYIAVTPLEPQAPVVDDTEYTSGSADFTTFVSVGNSLTAGYSDNALFIDGQKTSFPYNLAMQMSLAGGGDFTQPMMADNLGGMTFGGNPISGNRLYLADPFGSPAPAPVEGQGTTEVTNRLSGPFNNMGVPGAKSYHLLADGYGAMAGVPLGLANPYYARMATSDAANVAADAMSMSPTFFSLWIGNNDILGYATSGGVGEDHNETMNLDPSTYGGNDITNNNVFAQVYTGLVQTMISGGAQGILTNIPDVTTIPYFTTVPYNAIPLDAATAGALNAAFAEYNAGINQIKDLGRITPKEAEERQINFVEGYNAVLLLDEDLTDLTSVNPALTNMRQATMEDLLVFTSSTFLGTPADPNNPLLINGVSVPLEDKWVLTATEVQRVQVAQTSYNQTIASLAANYDLALFDAEEALTQLATTGITMDGLTTTSTYATGGAFSLDGVHPSPRGYAIISNLMLQVINSHYGSNLPQINTKDFTGVYLN